MPTAQPIPAEVASDPDTLQCLTAKQLAEVFPGTSLTWWARQFPLLVELKVISRRGNKHFSTLGKIEAWLTGDGA